MKTEVVPGRYDTWRSAEFYMYLVARAMYDAQIDPEALRADFCRRYIAIHPEALGELHSLREFDYPLPQNVPVERLTITMLMWPHFDQLIKLLSRRCRELVSQAAIETFGFLVAGGLT